MFRQAGLLCAALAIFSIAGGHWAVLQGMAWVQMLGDYSQRTGSLAVAAAQTFDGQHPCALCREIQAAKTKERRSDSTQAAGKEDFRVKARLVDAAPRLAARTVVGIVLPPALLPLGPGRTDPPPTPPPRRGLVA